MCTRAYKMSVFRITRIILLVLSKSIKNYLKRLYYNGLKCIFVLFSNINKRFFFFVMRTQRCYRLTVLKGCNTVDIIK